MKDQESFDESLYLESLTSSEALKRLLFEIEVAHQEHVRSQSPTLWELIYESFYPKSLYPITAIVWNLILSIFLYSDEHFIGATFILFSVFFNVTLTLNETRLKKTEIRRRLLFVASRLRSLKENDWNPPNYPHLHTPMAASIVLQWTLRDRHQVNLPWPLLVKGDVILIKPGQAAPGKSRSCNDSQFILQPGEILHIKTEKSSKIFSPTPEFRAPLQPQPFILLETPYMKVVHQFLDADKTFKKPLSLLTKYAHFYFVTLTQHVVIPLLWIILILASLVKRYTYKNESIFDITPVIIPVLSTVFPLSWLLINMAGVARVLEVFNSSRHLQLHDDDPFEEPENIQPLRTTSSFPSLKNYFLSALTSSGEFFTRRENIVHTLGSVNALCCTDKKGILSWPNTSAEKVFFLRKDESKITTEILNVTHDHQNPFKVEFDDPSWVTFLNDLKPIGLGILLNTCNLITEEKYTNFYNHLICESFQKDDLLPIATRGCLCELSRKIGFHRSKTAQDYHLTSQIQVFRHVKLDCHDKFAKNLSLARLKFPFPHMVSVLIQQRSTGTRQLFSQGTSDIILDSCIDFWSGKDLEALTEDARKKILDFYQRSSLSSYCTAFSYRPLTFGIPWETVREYLQLPTHSLPFYVHYSDPAQLCEDEAIYDHISLGNADKFISIEDDKENVVNSQDDALKCLEIECNQTFLGMVQLQYQPFVDVVQLIDLLEKACIRFVHFSKENELRSRVFSEKMGLESGWNCHISLKSQNKLDTVNKIVSYLGPKYPRKRKSESSIKMFRQTILGSSIPEDLSRPSWFLDFPQWKEGAPSVSEDEPHQFHLHTSHSTDAYSVHSDSSNPFDYDMSNRAKLPQGIENIRPHLKNMDDVPLLVSLFTDCTPATTTEMLVIMQEYGEVVCVLGSSSNHTNASIFLQADGSLGVEPLYPQICQSVPVFTPPKSGGMGPIELAGFLNSIVCSLSFKRKDEVSIFHLLLESRHFVLSFINTMQFWISSILALSSLHLFVFLLNLPSVLSINQNIWLNSFFIPILSLSCMGVPPDASIMNISTGKNILCIDIKYGLWCYGLRFIPSLLLITIIHVLASSHLEGKMHLFQELNMIGLQVYLVLISHSYLFRSYQTWQRFYCRTWCIITFLLLFIQLMALVVIFLAQEGVGNLNNVPAYVWGLCFSSLPIVLLINEIVKRQEIKINVRYQKLARLEFGTKLGINSPF
ncbi:transmembrane protein 94 [Lepeophtheirus salmonis]|uniref:transmembrane protein 94 n=1 Tax=Lepeophtheirus salmonis TaxID=72036 RepID=UPI001AE99AA9|nr:transmembrane protein 94-like [Lepeophtheirus salmonis]